MRARGRKTAQERGKESPSGGSRLRSPAIDLGTLGAMGLAAAAAQAAAGWIAAAGVIVVGVPLAVLLRARLMGRGGAADGERFDRVTQLLSRVSFEESLEIELERARRLGGS